MNPYRPGEPHDPFLAYLIRLEEWDEAKQRQKILPAYAGSDEEKAVLITQLELEEYKAYQAVKDMKYHAACVVRWMVAQAQLIFADDFFADPQPEAMAIWERAAMKWKAECIANGKLETAEVKIDEAARESSENGNTNVIPMWKRKMGRKGKA